jgi:Tol biopolymer transport system component
MSLRAGTRLGPYEVVAAIGAGGMGEVYRATDTRLDRQVAIKILPDVFARDAERVARFEREAKVLASLNHPSIAQIYGVETTADTQALVMEFVEGEDLAQRLTRGPIAVDEALSIALHVAEALEAAHEQGIVHRDLKPANIKVTAQGAVKVLDFGLAKLADPTPSSSAVRTPASLSPTIMSPAAMTGAGTLIGTAAYMSPEQARGREADRRSDVWAFGCVLFEMLSGRRAFDGDDVADALVSILSKAPDWNALPSTTPASIRRLLRRCLHRDRTLRLQAIGDARVEIHEALHVPDSPEVSAGRLQPSGVGRRAAVAIAIAAFTVGAFVAVPVVRTLMSAPAAPVARLSVALPAGERLPFTQVPLVAVAPDGSRVAFIAVRDGVRRLYLRQLESGEATAVSGSEGAEYPLFSPDGQWLAFNANGNLLKVSVTGGTPIVLCQAPNMRGLSWGDDGTMVFAPTYGVGGLVRVADGGGQPRTLVARENDTPAEGYRWPQLLSAEKLVLFTAWTRNIEESEIIAQRLDSSERKVVLRGGTHARYLPSGHLLYLRAGTLMAVRFDPARMEAIGGPVPVMQGVSMTTEGGGQYDLARAGSLIFVPGDVQGNGRTLQWVDRTGREESLDAPPRYYLTPRLSPDGRRIALVISEANDDVWVFDIGRRILNRLTSQVRSLNPVWTADGQRLIYRSTREGRINLFARNADGTGAEERLTDSPTNQTPQAVSPDGQLLVFGNQPLDLWTLPLTGGGKPRPFIESPFRESGAAISPDGTAIAYASDESGRDEVYVQPFPNGGAKTQVSTGGGQTPRWSASGEIFYLAGPRVVAVRVTTKPTLTVAAPQVLFTSTSFVTNNNPFDVAADGQRLLMIKEDDRSAASTRIDLVQNWGQELNRLAPR